MPGPFDTDDIGRGLEGLLGRAADVLSKGREELMRQSRIGKVKLFDLTQIRRERARLVLRLGEEAYRAMQAGRIAKDDLDRTYHKIVEMDERIAAKEAEIEKIRRAESVPAPKAAAPKKPAGATKPAPAAPKKRPADRGPRKTLGQDDDE